MNKVPTQLEIILLIIQCFRNQDITNLARFRFAFAKCFPVAQKQDLDVKVLCDDSEKLTGVLVKYTLGHCKVEYFISLMELQNYKKMLV